MGDIREPVDSTFLSCLFFTGVEFVVAGIRFDPPDLLFALIFLVLIRGGDRGELALVVGDFENCRRFSVADDVGSGGDYV